MSDEEKKAIEMIEYIQECNTLIGYGIKDRTILAKALLNLIEKQSKEIEELKEDKYGLEEEVQMQAKNIMLCEEALCEMQDKIKAKIEEYKKQIEKMEKDDIGRGFTLGKEWSDLKAKVEFGQSLLEKE